jgi:hypothetical protein
MIETARNARFNRRAVVRAAGMATLSVLVVAYPVGADAPTADSKKTSDGSWKSLFDGTSLDGWKASDFSRPGKTELRNSQIFITKGGPLTGITYARNDFPKTNYEFVLECQKLEGDDFFCTTTFPVDKSFCSFVVGGWGGTTVGLSNINSADASENETSTSREFKTNTWYRIRVRVTTNRIQTWIDDDKVVDVDIENKRISTRIECNPCKPFGVAAYTSSSAIRSIKVRPLTFAEIKTADETRPSEK